MSKNILTTAVLFLFVLFVAGCDKEKGVEINTESPYIEGLSIANYPVIDGSTSTLPLNTVIACELMGLDFEWLENRIDYKTRMWTMEPQIKGNLRRKFDARVLSSQTHNSLINLIDNKVDITLSARTLSPDEKAYADSKGVTLIQTPIALDAFIFIVNSKNSAEGLATKDIQDIYTGKITDWEELGIVTDPNYSKIQPYIRNANSGSQELMDMLVMNGLDYIDLPIYEEALLFTMAGMLDEIGGNRNAIGYTVYYYNEYIMRPGDYFIKTIAVDGVHPNTETITARTYPYTTQVYAVIRSDTDPSSMTYKVYEWLQSREGKLAVEKSGYIPN
ncbi:substrate-binding domain-containing protein [uncultured Alistipes sp.]|jgi:periplasmic phosphate-binding protein|uniref:PstS family phosphate ABC transporter substrate-binding protein n=1 Tax=uncultured Alistipes sp. TaxID=538949 RepID=UPI0025E258A3|nr:substrate-binding domain-containing protein [uncultured Alistipes sp.]